MGDYRFSAPAAPTFPPDRGEAEGTQLVFAWPALWWLTHYRELNERIQAVSRRVHDGDGYVVFDLRPNGAKKG